jgi:chemosensory pili system protein ChpA (sensor histidine kinase/response regulator)
MLIEDEILEPEDSSKDIVIVQKKSNVLSGNQIKVNSELLDNLVNYAGEVSIYRSRLEQEVGSFRINLSELGNTVARIREQLRKLDVETEAQILSTFQTDAEDETFDPLEMDRFSQLQQLSRSLAESVSDLTSIHSYLDDVARTSDNLLTQQSRVNTELQEGLMETRLVSFNSIVPRLRRLVRTTAKELEKPVKLEVHGAEGEMDKTVLEGVIAPLEHMLRNALAHGIEVNREKSNKPNQGSIIIDVRREATEVVITVADDGAGINREKVRKLAVDKGLLKKSARISDENIDRLILNSGFSTVEEISKLAGRGVGMDVVSNQINILGGSLDIHSEPSVGTKFVVRLPYTLALSSALLVEISETVYAIPVSGLEGIIRMPYVDYQQKITEEKHMYEYANDSYHLQELNKLLDIESEVMVENNQIPLVMIRSGDEGVALRVDKILGSREIVVKTVGTQISSVPGIYGATILGDGNVVLILDIIPLSRTYIKRLESIDESLLDIGQDEIEKDPVVMIVDDSITMRKVGERILRRNNYDVITAKDGLDALDNLKDVIPDVMLLDIEMPRMDGYELAIEMKKDEKYANIPIIMITSRTGEKHRQKAMDLGVDRYLGKPYQEADLLVNISELIEQQS